MRKALLVMCVLFALPLFAQDSSKLQLSVFASDPGYVSSSSAGSRYTGGFGAALEYRWNQQWALELQAASHQHYRAERSYPVDLLVHYRFQNDSRWKPFLGAGLRYEDEPFRPSFEDRSGFEIDGGVHFMLTPTVSLRMDAKQLLLNRSGEFEFDLRPSIGFGWKF